jgi:hypothetical protein
MALPPRVQPSARTRAYAAIDGERDWQDRKWGTPEQRPHEVGAWLTLMRKHLADAEAAWAGANNDGGALNSLRKVLAIGVACAEQHVLPVRWPHGPMEKQR